MTLQRFGFPVSKSGVILQNAPGKRPWSMRSTTLCISSLLEETPLCLYRLFDESLCIEDILLDWSKIRKHFLFLICWKECVPASRVTIVWLPFVKGRIPFGWRMKRTTISSGKFSDCTWVKALGFGVGMFSKSMKLVWAPFLLLLPIFWFRLERIIWLII